ncbi:MAG: hypothetical protein HQ511_12280 [Rhodospirillales bacterium]|nr:hypothetical protein [Rhodospirillales bacterium]
MFLHGDPKLTGDDRAVAIIEATNLEASLEDAIKTKFTDLDDNDHSNVFESDGPLASFSSKIRIGYALGVYGKHTRDDLNAIREIRNAFAHARKALLFNTKEITDVCDLLTVIGRTPSLTEFAGIKLPPVTPRENFIASTNLIQNALGQVYLKSIDLNFGDEYPAPAPLD